LSRRKLYTLYWYVYDLPHWSFFVVAFAGPVALFCALLNGIENHRTGVRHDTPHVTGAGHTESSTAGKMIRAISLIATEHYPPDEHFPERYQRIVNEEDPSPAPKPAKDSR
jgi:hypothetical protein